jgi:hypothetical protein
LVVTAGLVLVCGASIAEEPSAVDVARTATVWLEVDRVFQGYHAPLEGIGCAVGGEGIIVTCARTVSSEGTAQIMGISRPVEMRIVRVGVQGVLGRPAVGTVLARSRQSRLAIVRAEPAPVHAIDQVAPGGSPEDGDEVWIFEVVPGDGSSAAPEPRVRRTSVEVVSGRPVLADTDVQEPFLCGAPALDRSGALVGLVSEATVGGRTGIVPWQTVERFLEEERVHVQFRPPAVLSPPQPIDVTVTEVFGDLGAVAGTASLSGAGIEPLEVALTPSTEGWNATFRLVQRGPTTGTYAARVELVDASGEPVFVHETALEASDDEIIKLDDQRSAEEILKRRRELENPVTLSEYARSLQTATPTVAVEDEQLAQRLESWIKAAQAALDVYRYQEVVGSRDRPLVRRFDAVRRLLAMADGREPGAETFVRELQRHRAALERLHESLRRQVAARDLCVCDDSHWLTCAEATQCATMEKFGAAR